MRAVVDMTKTIVQRLQDHADSVQDLLIESARLISMQQDRMKELHQRAVDAENALSKLRDKCGDTDTTAVEKLCPMCKKPWTPAHQCSHEYTASEVQRCEHENPGRTIDHAGNRVCNQCGLVI